VPLWLCGYELIMQNKANLLDTQMNVNSFITKEYRKYSAFAVQKNKAKQSQFPKSQDEIKLLFNNSL
jgi:hypothetical protein